MHLLDVVAINNLGRTVTCFVALLDSQKFEAFLWALENLKKNLRKAPTLIFTDEEESLCKGFFFIITS